MVDWTHFEASSAKVLLGGRVIGPLRLGGHWYRMEKPSLLRVLQVLEVLRGAGLKALGSAPIATMRALVPLLVVDQIRPVDLRRSDFLQLSTVFSRWVAMTPLDFIRATLYVSSTEPGSGGRAGLAAAVCAMAQRYHCHWRDILDSPAEEVCAVLQAEAELATDDDGPSAEESAESFLEDLEKLGVKVVPDA